MFALCRSGPQTRQNHAKFRTRPRLRIRHMRNANAQDTLRRRATCAATALLLFALWPLIAGCITSQAFQSAFEQMPICALVMDGDRFAVANVNQGQPFATDWQSHGRARRMHRRDGVEGCGPRYDHAAGRRHRSCGNDQENSSRSPTGRGPGNSRRRSISRGDLLQVGNSSTVRIHRDTRVIRLLPGDRSSWNKLTEYITGELLTAKYFAEQYVK